MASVKSVCAALQLYTADGSVGLCGLLVSAAYEVAIGAMSVNVCGAYATKIGAFEIHHEPTDNKAVVGQIIDTSSISAALSSREVKSDELLARMDGRFKMLQTVVRLTPQQETGAPGGEWWMRARRTGTNEIMDMVWGHHPQENSGRNCMFPSIESWIPVHCVYRLPRTRSVVEFMVQQDLEAQKEKMSRAAAAPAASAAPVAPASSSSNLPESATAAVSVAAPAHSGGPVDVQERRRSPRTKRKVDPMDHQFP